MKILLKTVAYIFIISVFPLSSMEAPLSMKTLLDMIKTEDDTSVIQAIESGSIDVNASDENKLTLLMQAAKSDKETIVKALLDSGADVNAANKEGLTALHLAGNLTIVELLLNKGADIMAKDDHGITPLAKATLWGRYNVARALIDKGALVNIKTIEGITPLHWAVWFGRARIAQLLIDKGAHIGLKDNTGNAVWNLPYAKRQNIKSVGVALIVKNKARKIQDMMLKATKEGKQLLLQKLLDRFGDDLYRDWIDSSTGNTMLHIAILNRQYQLAAYIMAEFPKLRNKKNNKDLTALEVGILAHATSPDFLEFTGRLFKKKK